jgi:hypothetical protein
MVEHLPLVLTSALLVVVVAVSTQQQEVSTAVGVVVNFLPAQQELMDTEALEGLVCGMVGLAEHIALLEPQCSHKQPCLVAVVADLNMEVL